MATRYVYTEEDLQLVNDYRSDTFIQMNDIVVSGTYTYPLCPPEIDETDTYINTFTGTYNGGGYKITGLTNCLFGVTGNATISNLILDNINSTSEAHPGVLYRIEAGVTIASFYSSFSSIEISGNIGDNTATMTGGLFTSGGGNNIYRVSVTGNVTGISIIGGISVQSSSDNYSECFFNGNLYSNFIGGLFGACIGGDISNCFSIGTAIYVPGDTSIIDDILGPVAENMGVGLVASFVNASSFTNVYSAIEPNIGEYTVNVSYFQAFPSDGITITSNYFDNTLAPYLALWGETATPTEDMLLQETYIDWNFSTMWGISSSINSGYPYLLWLPPSALQIYFKQSGAWVQASAAYVKQNGVWIQVNEVKLKQSGVWV